MGKILDINGQPFDFDPEMQSVREDLPQVASRAAEHPSSGITPNRAALCLRAAERGDLIMQADLAADLEEKDTHLFAELSKRRLAIQSVAWRIEPPPNALAAEKKDAAMLSEFLQSAAWFEDGLFDATDAILKGYSMQEIEWGYLGKQRWPIALHWRDPALFCLNPDNYHEIRLRDDSYQGVALQPFGWVRHQAKSKTGYAGTQGLVRTLIWPFIFKNYSLRDFAEFLEIYGLPLKVGKYPSGASKEQKAALMRAVMDIGRRAGGIIPAGMSLDFATAANGQSDPFLAMMNWGEKTISKAILGSTLTSQTDTNGNRALGEVHNEVRKDIRNADLRHLIATLNRDLIYPMLAVNSASPLDPTRLPRFTFDTMEPEDMSMFADAIPKLAVGMPIPVSWLHDKLRIPVPQNDEPVFTATAATPLPTSQAPLSAQDAVPTPPAKDALDIMAEHVDVAGLNATIDPVLAPLITAIRQHGPEAAMQQAAALYPQMNDDDLIDMLTRAVFAAEVWGRLDATTD
ncbi:DUF935 domain-containing protein [Edwardsiella anguillarum]|uniref:Mu-like prophage FluMu protein gp29 n=1 Tax=Edwardsiella anguillarum ET080813 TaxID=667120 RepID=A0A076LMX3_9GAMM|nr:DUF935 family protein [Edwardsiella anguillarum]AIJ09271.1 Hypothetical protein ETEE_2838 [Edwardsiella anguillarum ET080813]KAB0589404.1 DUF935 domain-containing protein [Edwardsiella anguillarum]